MDDAARIAEMKNRGFAEAREQLPELRRHFFDREAEPSFPSTHSDRRSLQYADTQGKRVELSVCAVNTWSIIFSGLAIRLERY